jgi:CBS domain containing-hemolysin-like protein
MQDAGADGTRPAADGRRPLKQSRRRPRVRFALKSLAWWLTALGASPTRAAFLSGDLLDTVADWMALFVIFVVPCVVIVLFWIVHVLPEKIAHKRHHPQRDAIQTLCLLSLVFGGLLWPIAWLWAFTKPVGYRVAYGTDKHEDYYHEMAEKHRAGELLRDEIVHLREDLEAMEARGALPPKLRTLKDELARVRLADAIERAPKVAAKEGQA